MPRVAGKPQNRASRHPGGRRRRHTLGVTTQRVCLWLAHFRQLRLDASASHSTAAFYDLDEDTDVTRCAGVQGLLSQDALCRDRCGMLRLASARRVGHPYIPRLAVLHGIANLLALSPHCPGVLSGFCSCSPATDPRQTDRQDDARIYQLTNHIHA